MSSNETPGIGGVSGLPGKAGPSFRAWTRMMRSAALTTPDLLRKTHRMNRAIATLSPKRKRR